MRRDVLNALRTARGPITSLEIARQVIARRKLASGSRDVIMIRKRIGACLSKLKRLGLACDVPQAGEYKGWRLAT